MKIIKISVTLLFVSILFFSCQQEDNTVYKNVDELIKVVKQEINTIKVKDFKAIYDQKNDNVVIVDCRESKEYAEKHISGAINVPRGMLEFSTKLSDRRQKYYFYSNSNNRATLACYDLRNFKYKSITLLEGGLDKWLELYPKLFEEGLGGGAKAAPVKEESGGCGG